MFDFTNIKLRNRIILLQEVLDMGKWKIRGCPRCSGSLIIDKDEDGWYELCINCSYRNDLKVFSDPVRKPVLKVAPNSQGV
jgi:hypothetical protein